MEMRHPSILWGILVGILAGGWTVSLATAQNYRFPTSDADYGAFYPTAYKDNGGNTDWACGDFTYSGHGGSDYGGGSWTGMDEGRDIVAAATGVVVATNDGEYDRCSTGDCGGGGGYGNYVKVLHADGKSTTYGHLKTWTVGVSNGQTVTCGQKLGEMGSSGNSTGPHVHFEVREVGDYASDPFDGSCSGPPSYWVSQGDYGGLPGLYCEDVSPCTIAARLHCGETLSLANNGGGSTNSHGAYGGCSEYSYSGPEIAVEFGTVLTEGVTLRVGSLGADLDLLLLETESCNGTGCLGASVNSETADEAVGFTANAGQRYVAVVDGWEGAVSGFTLTAECTGSYPGEEVADDDTTPPPSDDDTTPPVADDDTGIPGDDDTGLPPDDDTGPSPGQDPTDSQRQSYLDEEEGACSGCAAARRMDGGAETFGWGILVGAGEWARRRRRARGRTP